VDCSDFDGQLARPPAEIAELARSFECVRVVDMRDVDLSRFRFDFDLTFAAMTAAADGTVLHRYGGRDAADAQSALSMASLAAFLRGSLAGHARRAGERTSAGAESPPAGPASDRTIAALPAFRRREREERLDCVHCHTVNDFEFEEAVAGGSWKREQMWVYPDPARLGLEVERDDQQRVARVEPDGIAAKAGLAPGDRLLRAGGQELLTRADLQWALHGLPPGATKLPLRFERDGEARDVALALPDGWKVADPLSYSWRAYKWNVPPQPGFGGKLLTAEEKADLGLARADFALRVNYLVTWGERAYVGRNAEKAGLRKGDVVLSIAGFSDFASEEHFQSWYRLTQAPGSEVEIGILREGKRRTLRMKVIE
jgi:hypothetical protein